MADLPLPPDLSTGWGNTLREVILRSNRQATFGVLAQAVVTGHEARPDAPVVIWLGGSTRPDNMREGIDLWGRIPVTEPVPELTAPTISTTSLAGMTQGTSTLQNLVATGSSPILWTVTGGTLPAGLLLSSTGVISGTPSGSGAYSFTATATNSAGSDAQLFTGTIAATPVQPQGRSVFGSGTGGITFTANNDGGSLRIANGFYTYGSGAAGAKATGMRIYIPAGMSIPSSGTAYIYSPPSGTPPVTSLNSITPITAPLTGLVAGGWNTILFPSAVNLTPGIPVYVGYEFNNGAYIASGAGAPVVTDPVASSPAGIALMESPASVNGQPWDRSVYRPNGGSWATSPSAPSYGVDILVEGI